MPTGSRSSVSSHNSTLGSRTLRYLSQSSSKEWPMFTGSARTSPHGTLYADSIRHGSSGNAPTTPTVVDESALLSALQTGQEWAFETVIRLYGGRLLAVARRFTRNDADAQDVLQSAYLS